MSDGVDSVVEYKPDTLDPADRVMSHDHTPHQSVLDESAVKAQQRRKLVQEVVDANRRYRQTQDHLAKKKTPAKA